MAQVQAGGRRAESSPLFALTCATFVAPQTKLPTYCICNEPQNPDRMMVLCDACENWYHSTCCWRCTWGCARV